MKFIILLEGKVWDEAGTKELEDSIQPVYRFHYENSATSIFYHCSYIERQALFATVNINVELATIAEIMAYFYPKATYVPFLHIMF